MYPYKALYVIADSGLMIREEDLTPNGSKLSYICNRTKKTTTKNTHRFFFYIPGVTRDFAPPPLRGYMRCATQILIDTYNHTFANIVVAAQRDSLAVILPKRDVAKGHLSG